MSRKTRTSGSFKQRTTLILKSNTNGHSEPDSLKHRKVMLPAPAGTWSGPENLKKDFHPYCFYLIIPCL